MIRKREKGDSKIMGFFELSDWQVKQSPQEVKIRLLSIQELCQAKKYTLVSEVFKRLKSEYFWEGKALGL
jgi:hypothetical protein